MRPGLILSVAAFLFGATAGLLLGSGRTLFAQEGTPQGLAEAQAVMGTAFTFQGQLYSDGTPSNGAFEMRFTLFDAAEAGSQIGDVLSVQQVVVSDGAFAVRLDFGTGAFSGEARYLQVEVRSPVGIFTLLSPRQELTPGIYALFSAGAAWSGLTGVPAGFADGIDNVGTGGGGDILGGLSCTKDQVVQWDGSVWVCSNTVKNLLVQMAALETMLAHFSRDGNEITITGANLHVVNGTGTTDGDPNGLGNVIIGYNELRASVPNTRTGSHMLVVGAEHNYSSFGGLVVGQHNETSGMFASVSGGYDNTASGNSASISGGSENTASKLAASVSGGSANIASGGHASVSAGYGNTASLDHAAVSGGSYNTASNYSAAVSGGGYNTASGIAASVSAGYDNTASLDYASVSGGRGNFGEGPYASVSGGSYNSASATNASVSGGANNRASAENASVSGGRFNTASGKYSSVSGGYNNSASAEYASVSGGANNTASGKYSSVSGGENGQAEGEADWRAGDLLEDY